MILSSFRGRRIVGRAVILEIAVIPGIKRVGISEILMLDFESVVDDDDVNALAGRPIPGIAHTEAERRAVLQVPLIRVERIVDRMLQGSTQVRFTREHGGKFPPAGRDHPIGGVERGEGVRVSNQHPAFQRADLFTRGLGRGKFGEARVIHADQKFGRHGAACGGETAFALSQRHCGQQASGGQVGSVVEHGG